MSQASTPTRRFAVPAVMLAALVAASAGCKKTDAIDRVVKEEPAAARPQSAGNPVLLEVTVAKPEVTLGDEIVFSVKLTNSGASSVQVNRPRIDRRSVGFRVRRPDGTVAKIERNWATQNKNTGQILPDAPEAIALEPGKSHEEKVTTVAVMAGKFSYTLSYVRQGWPEAALSEPIEVTVTPADAKASRLAVRLETTHGTYTAAFRPDVSFNTVESFAALTKKGYFNGVKFHRIIKGFMAQGGDPTATGEGGPGYFLALEANPIKLPHRRGVLSMARQGDPAVDTAGSQFFLMFKSDPGLDRGRYTTFGEMVDGDATLKALENVPVGMSPQGEMSAPKETVLIKLAQLIAVP